MATNEIPAEVMKLAEKLRNTDFSSFGGSNWAEKVARIIHDAGTFTPNPEPTRGEVIALQCVIENGPCIYLGYPEKTEGDGSFNIHVDSLRVGKYTEQVREWFAALIDSERADAAKRGAEGMRERCTSLIEGRTKPGSMAVIRIEYIIDAIRNLDTAGGK